MVQCSSLEFSSAMQYDRIKLITGWWFGTWILFFHSVGNVIIPSDFHSLHDFSEGLNRNHQHPPTRYNSTRFCMLLEQIFTLFHMCPADLFLQISILSLDKTRSAIVCRSGWVLPAATPRLSGGATMEPMEPVRVIPYQHVPNMVPNMVPTCSKYGYQSE